MSPLRRTKIRRCSCDDDSYRGGADSENRIKELKYDFSIDDFVTNNFWATEACGSFIVMAYNFMSLFRHALINSDKKQFLKTIRYELISTSAYLGKNKDKHILYLARSLKTKQAFITIWGKNKRIFTTIQYLEGLMTDLGLSGL